MSKRPPAMLVCTECEMRFDPRDARAAVYADRPSLNACPACNAVRRGRAAWAVYNGCNGIFGCSVRETKDGAIERLQTAGYFDPASESVVPVIILFGEPFVVEDYRHRQIF